jgi:hypothetical protein
VWHPLTAVQQAGADGRTFLPILCLRIHCYPACSLCGNDRTVAPSAASLAAFVRKVCAACDAQWRRGWRMSGARCTGWPTNRMART